MTSPYPNFYACDACRSVTAVAHPSDKVLCTNHATPELYEMVALTRDEACQLVYIHEWQTRDGASKWLGAPW